MAKKLQTLKKKKMENNEEMNKSLTFKDRLRNIRDSWKLMGFEIRHYGLLKYIGLSVITLAVVGGTVLARRVQQFNQRAAVTNASLGLPSTVTANIGETFTIPVTLSTDGYSISSADVIITFDRSILEVVSVRSRSDTNTLKSYLPQTNGEYDNTMVTNRANQTGKIEFGAIAFLSGFSTGGYNGTLTESNPFAQITFKSLKATAGTPINFVFNGISNTTDSNLVSAVDNTDILGKVQNSVLSVKTSPTPTPSSAPVTNYVYDNFERTLSGTWGSANQGGNYSYSPSSTDLDVNGSSGSMTIRQAADQINTNLPGVSAKNIEFQFRVKTDKLPSGGLFISGITARDGVTGNYRVVFKFEDGKVYLQGQKYLTSTGLTYDLADKVELPGINQLADNYYWIKGQVTGSSPTTVKIKAWHINDTEPGNWQFSATDSSSTEITTAGTTGIMSRVGSGNTSLPVKFFYDEFKVSTP